MIAPLIGGTGAWFAGLALFKPEVLVRSAARTLFLIFVLDQQLEGRIQMGAPSDQILQEVDCGILLPNPRRYGSVIKQLVSHSHLCVGL